MIELRYKCACMPTEVALSVRYHTSDEDVVEWMRDVVQQEIGRDHANRSPLCMRNAMEYAKIPVPENAPYVGGKPELHS